MRSQSTAATANPNKISRNCQISDPKKTSSPSSNRDCAGNDYIIVHDGCLRRERFALVYLPGIVSAQRSQKGGSKTLGTQTAVYSGQSRV